jgi:hypothetical protein
MVRLPPNSALDRTVRPVTLVAVGQRARQSVPPVSASVRQTLVLFLAFLAGAGLVVGSCAKIEPVEAPPPEAEVLEAFFLHLKAVDFRSLPSGVPQPPERIWVADNTDLVGGMAEEACRGLDDPPTRSSVLLNQAFLDLSERRELRADHCRKANSHVLLSAVDPHSRLFTLTKPQSSWPVGRGRYHVSRVAFDGARRYALVTYCAEERGRSSGCLASDYPFTLFKRDGGDWKVVGGY